MSITLKDICKFYGDQPVVDQINLEILPGEFFVLLGTSGSGKTTILRMIAGLVAPDKGEICLKGEVVNHVSPQKRNIGFVFQNYSLFRHMTVGENIAFGLRLRRVPPQERQKRVNQLLEMIGLPGFGDRYPSQLSGGQQQRIAVARALAYEPQVLLLDEPFGALDLTTRVQLRQNLKNIHQQLGITSVLVTHDQGDAFELGDRIGVMEKGKLLAVGAPSDVYRQPKSEYVAQFLGAANFFSGQMQDDKIQIGNTLLPLPEGITPPEKGKRVQILIRPEQLEVVANRNDLHGTFLGDGEMHELLFAGSFYRMTVRVQGIVRSRTGTGDTDPSVLFAQIGVEKAKRLPFHYGLKVVVGVISFHILPWHGLNILVGIDGSVHAQHALQFGASLAKLTQGTLNILGVAERYLEEEKAREGLSHARQILQKEVQELTTIYRRGHPAEEILNETEKNSHDLIVLGTRGRQAPTRFLGSTAVRVAMNAPIPTLLVPTPIHVLENILICISGEKARKSDIRFVGRIARSTGARITLFHVSRREILEKPPVFLQEVLQILTSIGLNVRIKIGEGEVISAILKEADAGNYNLLVLGTRAGSPGFLGESVTSQVLAQTDKAVLVLHIRPPA